MDKLDTKSQNVFHKAQLKILDSFEWIGNLSGFTAFLKFNNEGRMHLHPFLEDLNIYSFKPQLFLKKFLAYNQWRLKKALKRNCFPRFQYLEHVT